MHAAEEADRLAALGELELLDSPPEPMLDRLARLAASLCGTPIALVSLVDAHRQWFKANVGLEQCAETPREVSFCAYAIEKPELCEVVDASLDPRFASNPLVQGDPFIRFYAGMPLQLPSGHRIGTLCVIDRKPQRLSDAQRAQLQHLAALVVEALLARQEVRNTSAQTARVLAASELKFRQLSEFSPIGVFHTDVSGMCTYTNSAWRAIYGLDAKQALGAGWARGLYPDDAAAVLAQWTAAAQSGRGFDMQFRIRQPSGVVLQVHSRSRPLRNSLGRIVGHVGVVEDITERLRAERELRRSQAQLDYAAQLSGVGAWRVELEPEIRIVWSDQTARLHDLEPGHQPLWHEAAGYYEAVGLSALEQAFARASQSGERYDLELPIVTAQGRKTWLRSVGEGEREGGRVVRVVGAAQDVGARRNTEAALARTLFQLRQLYERTPALLMSLDGQGRVLAASDALLHLLGRQRQELEAVPELLDWATTDSCSTLQRHVLPTLWRSGEVLRVACAFQGAQGQRVDMLLSAVLDAEQGGGQRALAVLEDVTEATLRANELRQEQALRQQIQAHVAELNTLLAERNEMLDVLAHEVRQPLNNASAALQAAAGSLQGEVLEAVQRAQRVLGQVRIGVDNTLAAAALLANHESPTLDDVDLDLLIGIALGDFPEAERARLQLQRLTATRTVTVDFGLMRLALRNLLVNALVYGPEGSPVYIRLSDSDAPLALMIDVIDCGPGIDPALQPRLFQRGVRGPATSTRGSHGLGLYIARLAMERQGGKALLLSSGPGGTAMRLELA
jgi:PAS domain S-box-containing protein